MAANDEIQPNPHDPLSGENPASAKQTKQNAQEAARSERSINPALGSTGAIEPALPVRRAAESFRPKGTRPSPQGATSLRLGITRKFAPRGRGK